MSLSNHRICLVDVGTNSVRMMVADVSNQRISKVILTDGKITRLGEGLHDTGIVGEAALSRTVELIAQFLSTAAPFRPDLVRLIGTSAVRQASNQADVLKRVFEATGVPLEVIGGETEAIWTYHGALGNLFDLTPPYLVIDIGGGSTELIYGETLTESLRAYSVEVGVVTLTERMIHSDPPKKEELENARREVKRSFEGVISKLLPFLTSSVTCVGTAGTVTTLMAFSMGMSLYDPKKIHGHGLQRSRITELVSRLSSLTLSERLKLPGIEKGREDLILSGGIILDVLMEQLNLAGLIVSDSGLREGALLKTASLLK
ncbi:Ppx/GppA phosphatase family protein [Leptospirillum ferrooxidans]|uniref:Putative Ppx/GppA phosphatase n=1 Tax=Leptospirillum ferrooxidans (strain C2-3) TaxID=1162668 RepID=I0IPN1_LEPFC|nr:Ppx/GppA phosphatase family protein [Leptospirillum ferrooxidans]BAM07230.1 putative Ppx/GppA phosphatase [Leptospirillum ferrooxidans C2-3]